MSYILIITRHAEQTPGVEPRLGRVSGGEAGTCMGCRDVPGTRASAELLSDMPPIDQTLAEPDNRSA